MEETKDTALKSRITLVCTGKTHLKAGEVGLVFRTVDGDGGALPTAAPVASIRSRKLRAMPVPRL